nr:hypothetical protein [Rhodococcus wratislaviensis]
MLDDTLDVRITADPRLRWFSFGKPRGGRTRGYPTGRFRHRTKTDSSAAVPTPGQRPAVRSLPGWTRV